MNNICLPLLLTLPPAKSNFATNVINVIWRVQSILFSTNLA